MILHEKTARFFSVIEFVDFFYAWWITTVWVLIGKSQKALSEPHDMLSLLDIDNYS